MIDKGTHTSPSTRHIKIRYFFINDLIRNGELQVEYLPTDEMISDILTKPLQGQKFLQLRRLLLNWKG
jgi:hypothetical protein